MEKPKQTFWPTQNYGFGQLLLLPQDSSQTLLPLGRYNQFSSICTPCPYTSTLGQISNDMLDISASSHRLKHLRGGTTLHSFLSPSQCQPPSRCSVHAGSKIE